MSGQPSSSKSPTAAPAPCRYILHGIVTQPSPSTSHSGGQLPGKNAVSISPTSVETSVKSSASEAMPSGAGSSGHGSQSSGSSPVSLVELSTLVSPNSPVSTSTSGARQAASPSNAIAG